MTKGKTIEKVKTVDKSYNDKVFADVYFDILGNSTANNRVRFLELEFIDQAAFDKALALHSDKVAQALREKYKHKIK